jgi:hypothetical protein
MRAVKFMTPSERGRSDTVPLHADKNHLGPAIFPVTHLDGNPILVDPHA